MLWWGQNLILSFKDCDIAGAITSSVSTHKHYSYYMAPADNQYGGIPVDASGHEIAGKWEKPSFGPPMPEGRRKRAGYGRYGRPWTRCPPWRGCPPCPEPKFYFTPDYDEGGKLIPIGTEVLSPHPGLHHRQGRHGPGRPHEHPRSHRQQRCVGEAGRLHMATQGPELSDPAGGGRYVQAPRTVLVDGTPVVPEPGKVYTGRIIVTA